MRPVGRRWGAALVVMLAVVPLLVGCGSDGGGQHTIAILQAVAVAPDRHAALLDALAKAGYGGSDLHVLGADEVHGAEADAEAAVRAWVADGAELVVALSTTSAQAARKATSTVPIVVLSNDLAASGLVDDERHPGANVTGTSYRVPSDRLLAIADDAFGSVAHVGCLYPSGDPGADPVRTNIERGAKALGLEVTCASFADPTGVAAAVRQLAAAGATVLYLVNTPATVQAVAEVEAAALAAKLPVLATNPTDFATLILEPDGADVYAQLGRQAARLLDGAKVVDVPVQDPGKFVLIVNTKVAAEIGRAIAPDVVDRADQVVR
jgi:putative ABC transport system substrate-binding protein